VVGDKPTYVSFDIDSIDPAFAPGTGTPEVGGLTTLEAQGLIRGLRGLNLVGADVVEVSPPFDPFGNTALIGATIMYEILCLLAEKTHSDAETSPFPIPDWVRRARMNFPKISASRGPLWTGIGNGLMVLGILVSSSISTVMAVYITQKDFRQYKYCRASINGPGGLFVVYILPQQYMDVALLIDFACCVKD